MSILKCLTEADKIDERKSAGSTTILNSPPLDLKLSIVMRVHTRCMTIASKTEEKDSIPKLVRGETYTHSQSGYSEDCIPPGDACGLNWGAVNLSPARG